MSKSSLEASIPVLTEIIEMPHLQADEELAAAAMPEPRAEAVAADKAVDVQDIDGWLNEEWNRLERRIGGRILHQVMERLESEIEQRVRDSLADVLQVAVEGLAADIKVNLQSSLHEAIFQAVKDEVSRMQYAKR
jgi:hypothetical protein